MGAWGPRSFDNDSALDWLNGLTDSDDDGALIDALADVLDAEEGEYLDADVGMPAVAAAEVIAALGGRRAQKLPAPLEEWIGAQSADVARELVEKHAADALEALGRVSDGPSSELAELWDSAADWRAAIDDLAARLRADQHWLGGRAGAMTARSSGRAQPPEESRWRHARRLARSPRHPRAGRPGRRYPGRRCDAPPFSRGSSPARSWSASSPPRRRSTGAS